MTTQVYINGTLVSDPNSNSLFEQLLDAQVFETMVICDGVIFRLSEHLDRLWNSARTIGIAIPTDRNKIEHDLILIARKSQTRNMCIRLAATERDVLVWTFERSTPKNFYSDGIQLSTSAIRRNATNAFFPEAKSNQVLNAILSLLDSEGTHSFETLLLDLNGYVKESRVWNLFIIKRELLKTPSTDGILNGVTRNFVIECARLEKIPVIEGPFTRHDVWNAEEAFLTNTSGGILPIRSLDGRKIGCSTPGKITERLSKRYELEFQKEIKRFQHGKN